MIIGFEISKLIISIGYNLTLPKPGLYEISFGVIFLKTACCLIFTHLSFALIGIVSLVLSFEIPSLNRFTVSRLNPRFSCNFKRAFLSSTNA